MRDKGDHYEYIATYVDDLLIASRDPKAITDELIGPRFNLKLKGTGPVKFHLGCDYIREEDGTLLVTPRSYIDRFLGNFQRIFGERPTKRTQSPLEKGDHPEVDTSPELDMDGIKKYQSIIGGLQWIVSLGRFDITTATMTMAGFRAIPHEGHLERLKRMCNYLYKFNTGGIRVRVEEPDFSDVVDTQYDWSRIYGNVKEIIPEDLPRPLGKPVVTSAWKDANLYHCYVTGRAVTAILHLLNQTPIDWYSKKQSTVETATYGSEFVAGRIAVDQIIDLRMTLRYLGVPLKGKGYLFGDNESVVQSGSVPHSRLNKRHNALSYHRVREAIAAGILIFTHVKGQLNPSDILSKHWGHADVWPMLNALLFCSGETATLLPADGE